MVQMRQAMATLRLTLAQIAAKEEQLDALIRQFRTQLNRIPRQVIYGRNPLDASLSAMAEVEERLHHAQAMRHHLQAIKQRAQEELEALELLQKVEEAKDALEKLKERLVGGANSDDQAAAEIRRLEEYIAQYSKQAERAITAGHGEEKR